MAAARLLINIPGYCSVTNQLNQKNDGIGDLAVTLRETQCSIALKRRRSTGDGSEAASITKTFALSSRSNPSTPHRGLEWRCSQCTCRNPVSEAECAACGGLNERLAREKRRFREEEREQRGLEAVRDAQARQLTATSLREVMEDLGDDLEELDGDAGEEVAASPALVGPSAMESGLGPFKRRNTSHSVTSNSRSVAFVLPPDLLLRCAFFLLEPRELAAMRCVCVTWSATTFGDDEGGSDASERSANSGGVNDFCSRSRRGANRLWHAVFKRLRARGDISADPATSFVDARAEPKVYNLAVESSSGSSSSASGNGDNDEGAATTSAGDGVVAAASGGISGGMGRTIAANAASCRMCRLCKLLQRPGYAGASCEMCGSEVVARETGAQSKGSPSSSSKKGAAALYRRVNLRPAVDPVTGREIGASAAAAAAGAGAAVKATLAAAASARSTENAAALSAEDAAAPDDGIDWPFVVKRGVCTRRTAAKWGTLHSGWEWLSRWLRGDLARRWTDVSVERPPLSFVSGSSSRAGNSSSGGGKGTSSCNVGGNSALFGSATSCCSGFKIGSGGAGSGDSGGTSSASSSSMALLRVLHKLAARNWVLLYESICAEFALQADGLAREAMRCIAAAPSPSSTREDSAEHSADTDSDRAFLVQLLRAFEAFKEWCEGVDELSEPLNEAVNNERQAMPAAAAAAPSQTPFVRDAALLAFRNHFVLQRGVCRRLQRAVAKGIAAARAGSSGPGAAGAAGRTLGQQGPESDLFTDEEFVEDCRVLNFAAGDGIGASTAAFSSASRRYSAAAACSSSASGVGNVARTHYYDWFVTKMEQRADDIVRGVEPTGGIGRDLAERTFSELLADAAAMVGELDVPDDAGGRERQTQGSFRRLLLVPFRRWHALTAPPPQPEGQHWHASASQGGSSHLPMDLMYADISSGRRNEQRRETLRDMERAAGMNGCAKSSWRALEKVFA